MPKVPVGPDARAEFAFIAKAVLARAMKEEGPGGLREAVELIAHQLGYEVRHIRNSRAQNVADLPDLFLIRNRDFTGRLPGRAMWVELKREGKNPTPGQEGMMKLMGRAGLEAYVFRPSDLFTGKILAILRGREEMP